MTAVVRAGLVLVDISGYTRFVVMNRISILHAEQLITDLIEAIAAEARFPLSLHKLEGDAALFVHFVEDEAEDVADDIAAQAKAFFGAFRARQKELFENSIGGCFCDACQHVENLHLKAILHCGEVVRKKVQNFDEIAGEPVILIHRLLKNSIKRPDYLLMTDTFAATLSIDPFPTKTRHVEMVDDFGAVSCVLYDSTSDLLVRPSVRPLTRPRGLIEIVRLFWESLGRRRARARQFRHLG